MHRSQLKSGERVRFGKYRIRDAGHHDDRGLPAAWIRDQAGDEPRNPPARPADDRLRYRVRRQCADLDGLGLQLPSLTGRGGG